MSVASVSSLTGQPGDSALVAFPTQAAYAASKGAIAQLTRVIAVEYGGQNIRANAVLPAVVKTDIMDGVVENGREMLASFGSQHPLGRDRPTRQDRGGDYFLASPTSSFMTGALVMVDGGWTAQ